MNNLKDLFTLEIANRVSEKLFTLTGLRPHMIINNLHRKKLDPNREKGEGAVGVEEAETAWSI